MLLDIPQTPQAVINPPQVPALLSPAQQPPDDPNCTPKGCPVPAPVPMGYAEYPGIFDEQGRAVMDIYRVVAIAVERDEQGQVVSDRYHINVLTPSYGSLAAVNKALKFSLGKQWTAITFYFPETGAPF